jgi:hypothetical protein
MSEEPIKLFSKISERYPEPDDTDQALALTRSLIGMVPLGGSLLELLSPILGPPVERRRGEWAKDLADVVESTGRRMEELASDDVFVSSVIRTSRIAIATHRANKRQFLKNMLIKIGSGCAPDEDMLEVYFRIIEDLTPSHIVLLDFLWMSGSRIAKLYGGTIPVGLKYQEILGRLLPELSEKQVLVQQILQDLAQYRLINGAIPGTDLSQLSFPQQMMTNQGINLLNFVLSPENLQGGRQREPTQ